MRKLSAGGLVALAYFTEPKDVHPKYVQENAYLPTRGQMLEHVRSRHLVHVLMEQWEIREDFHNGEHHQHAVERLVIRKA